MKLDKIKSTIRLIAEACMPYTVTTIVTCIIMATIFQFVGLFITELNWVEFISNLMLYSLVTFAAATILSLLLLPLLFISPSSPLTDGQEKKQVKEATRNRLAHKKKPPARIKAFPVNPEKLINQQQTVDKRENHSNAPSA